MFLALVYYPRIEHGGFHAFRNKYEPFSKLLPEHIPFIFPVPESIGIGNLESHITKILSSWEPFRIHFCSLDKTQDHWLFLAAKEGNNQAIMLHDDLYQGILASYLRKDLPYTPHIGLGLFSKEKYDFHNPTAALTLDEQRYIRARKEFEDLKFDLWCSIDHLTLVKVNDDFSECHDMMNFKINTN